MIPPSYLMKPVFQRAWYEPDSPPALEDHEPGGGLLGRLRAAGRMVATRLVPPSAPAADIACRSALPAEAGARP